ncbi:MAG: alkaline phosphatase D family protein [Pseudomonadota bacterium]
MTTFTRRTALTSGFAVTAASCAGTPKMTPYSAVQELSGGIFAHGVASGDPAADSVLIWTRISGVDGAAEVAWEVASDPDFAIIAAQGVVTTNAARDFTVKAIPEELSPGAQYYYRFLLAGEISPVGRTRTLPIGETATARFAVVSCSNYPFGYFNVYDLIARRDDLDAVLHLGDYFYEYSTDGYGGEIGRKLGRQHIPAHEVVSLDDYRRRHAQYKSDPSLQALHGAHPMIPIWDDHETSNDSWTGGAENHDPATEGDWAARKRAALQAYYEWMPIRDPKPERVTEAIFRSFSFGDLLTLTAIETRLMARSEPFEYSAILPSLQTPEAVDRFRTQILADESRELLGQAQLDYLERAIRQSVASNQPWRLVANQIIMAKVKTPDITPHVTDEDVAALEKEWDQARAFVAISALGLPYNFDAWDGYPAARNRFYDLVRRAGSDGVIVVTGDTHTWWANDLIAEDGQQMGVELGTHSVTSPSPFAPSFLGGRGAEYALLANRDNKDVRYVSGENHGYIDLTITHSDARAEFVAVDTIESLDYNAFVKVAFDIKKTKKGVAFSDADGLGFKEGFLF